MGGASSICEHRDGLPGVPHQRDVLSVSAEAQRRERVDRGLAAGTDQSQEDVGLWPVLPASSQRQRLSLEPQARLPDLSRVGAEHADQAAQTAATREA